jgi:hypothetical protein
MVRLPRPPHRFDQAEMDRMIRGYFYPDWLEEMYLYPPQPSVLAGAVRLALLNWN